MSRASRRSPHRHPLVNATRNPPLAILEDQHLREAQGADNQPSSDRQQQASPAKKPVNQCGLGLSGCTPTTLTMTTTSSRKGTVQEASLHSLHQQTPTGSHSGEAISGPPIANLKESLSYYPSTSLAINEERWTSTSQISLPNSLTRLSRRRQVPRRSSAPPL